jgi:hypothetical protein
MFAGQIVFLPRVSIPTPVEVDNLMLVRRQAKLLVITLVCLLAGAAGCGGNALGLVEVNGTVTLDGTPLSDADVIFQPVDGRPSIGRTDSDGYYELNYMDDKQGALPGTHQVRITTYIERDLDHSDPAIQEGRPERLPAIYNRQTTLSADLKPDQSNTVDFALQSAAGKSK